MEYIKILVIALLLPILSFSQSRIIGFKTDSTYKFEWDINRVVQKTFDDLSAPFTVDSTYVMSDTAMQVIFSDNEYQYSNIFWFETNNDTIYTTSRSTGCLNSCQKELDCTRCAKKPDCDCYCYTGYGSCSNKNLAVFQNITISQWIMIRILTHQKPEE
jgi:hypothetical protein